MSALVDPRVMRLMLSEYQEECRAAEARAKRAFSDGRRTALADAVKAVRAAWPDELCDASEAEQLAAEKAVRACLASIFEIPVEQP